MVYRIVGGIAIILLGAVTAGWISVSGVLLGALLVIAGIALLAGI